MKMHVLCERALIQHTKKLNHFGHLLMHFLWDFTDRRERRKKEHLSGYHSFKIWFSNRTKGRTHLHPKQFCLHFFWFCSPLVIHILSISHARYTKAITLAINFSVDLIVVWNDVRKKSRHTYTCTPISPIYIHTNELQNVDVRAEWLNYIVSHSFRTQSNGLYLRFYFSTEQKNETIVPHRKLHSFFFSVRNIQNGC